MPNTFPPDSERPDAATSLPVSPREAAMSALVYRRGLREKPRESMRRIAGWVGTILIHLMFLFGMILGPAYDVLPPPPEPDNPDVLQVRLMDKPPPPLPPVRGTPSTAPVATVKHTTTWNTKASRAARGSHAAAVASASKATPAVATPAARAPKVKAAPRPAAPPPSVAAVADRPLVQPKAPPPQPELEKVPVPTQAPPDLALDTPKPVVVPPRFQPEPVRRAQVEGLAPMPPPASLALPPTPAAQMTVTPTPPEITSEKTTPVPTAAMTLATVPRPEVEESAAPPTPQEAPLPQVAAEPVVPTPDLTVDNRPVPPKVTVQAVTAPPVEATADLEAVPLPDATAKPTVSAPVAAVDRPAVQAPAVTPGELQRPVAGADNTPAAPGQAPGDTAAGESPSTAQTTAATQGKDGKNANAEPVQGVSGGTTSPGNANVAGSNTPGAAQESGKPGAAKGVDEGERLTGANGTSNRSDGVVGGQGDKTGQVGAYVELKPRGNINPQNGARVHIDYKATRFEGAWTPKGESSVDTALRHGVEGTTQHFSVPLPRGIQIGCTLGPGTAGGAMKAISIFTMGCGGDPPPKPANVDATAKNQTMAPAKPLAENLPPANASTVAGAAVALDNTPLCTTARITGGPLPPGCEASIKINVPVASPASGSWVPASDQFKK